MDTKVSSIVEDAAGLPVNYVILDGEIAVSDPDGKTSFSSLIADIGAGRGDRTTQKGITALDDFDWEAFGNGCWADEYPGLRELLDQKAAEQKEKRDGQEG